LISSSTPEGSSFNTWHPTHKSSPAIWDDCSQLWECRPLDRSFQSIPTAEGRRQTRDDPGSSEWSHNPPKAAVRGLWLPKNLSNRETASRCRPEGWSQALQATLPVKTMNASGRRWILYSSPHWIRSLNWTETTGPPLRRHYLRPYQDAQRLSRICQVPLWQRKRCGYGMTAFLLPLSRRLTEL